MKKLILLLFIPLIFACSDESSDSDNNNSNNPNVQKLIESITLISGDCLNPSQGNLWLNYDNQNRISSFQSQVFDINSGCNTLDSNMQIREMEIEYTDDELILHYQNEALSFPVNDEGLLDDPNTTFENGYLIAQNGNAIFNEGGCDIVLEWVDNNLISSIQEGWPDCGDDTSGGDINNSTFNEYYQNLNPIQYYTPSRYNDFLNVLMMTGLFGKSSQNLILSETWDNGNRINNYQYQFDNDGYPIEIYIESVSNSGWVATVGYQITYIQ